MPQFHYTDRLTARDILKAGRIRAKAMTLHKDMWGQDTGFTTPPLVWLTINPIMEGTVVAKLRQAGWPSGLVNDLWRFVLPDDYSPLGLAEYSEKMKIDMDWWVWIVRTGTLASSDYTTWRCHSHHILAKDWIAIEVLSGYAADSMPIWTAAPAHR